MKRLKQDGSPIVEQTLHQITELYTVKKSVRNLGPEDRLVARRQLSAPTIADFSPWLEARWSRIARWSKLTEDMRYTSARWLGLNRFVEDGRLELTTNPVENQIRMIVLSRKMPCSPGTSSANRTLIASLLANCKMCDVDPVSYLSNTLRA